ncbi:DNA ligase 4 [Sparassis crispa]|uniref:DNA ligase n=1 Tax=Sparassis crispa TaxID=139825 RepID=A0A401GWF6_9APHY|nr:DNA ligase 4 [Sparassis crispa]GBE86558.1 DNA ligase 4 [Sparassis crispa]
MLPTPAPSSPPSSPILGTQPAVTAEDHDIDYPVPPQNVDSAPFYVLSALFDKLQNERKPEKRRKLLNSWFNHWRAEKGFDLYPVLRLILPQKDRERAVYGLKEKNLAKTYIKIIPLGMRDPDAIRLLNWKRPTERDKVSGDFPTVLYEVISKRSSVIEGSLSIDEVNEALDQLSRNMGKHDIQTRVLQRIYNRSTPEEQRWIARIILKDMIISVKETTVFSVFHPDAHDLFNTCSDLKKIAWELWDPHRRLNEEDKAVQLFRAFAPMLCKRPTRKIEDSVKEMQGGTFIIEEKMDGERMQLHKRGNEYFYCSRKGKDYTYLYGKHVGTGSLTPFIDAAFDPRVDEIILDGEMLVWDPVVERNLPFGTLKTAALNKSKKDYNPRPCFKVFDLLYLNGLSLLHKSLKFRKRNLRACLAEVKGRIEYAVEFEGCTAKDVRDRMDEIMASRGEGLVLKHPESEYVLNGRNRDWIKVKPEYMDNMGETVDVLVVAGNYGTGRRSGGVSTLICAVLDDRRPPEDDEPKYSTFVRIGSGLSYADYIWMRQKPWKVWDEKNPPSFLQASSKGHEDKGDIYLEPEDSFIVKVKAAEIVSSELYHMGLTMRFPRALTIRDDLSIADCMTASAILEGVRSEKKRKMDTDDGKPKKKARRTAKKPALLREYQGGKMTDVKIESDLFEGMKFMVASDPKSQAGEQDKKELLTLIHANGGKYVHIANSDPNMLVVYGGTTTPYDIKLIMNKGICDIIKPRWITDCIAKKDLVPLRKKYFFHATEVRKLSEEYGMEDESEDEHIAVPIASPTPEASTAAEGKELEDVDPAMAEWFKVDEKLLEKQETATLDDGSETEPDSDNEDVRWNEDAVAEELDDDWFNVKSADAAEPTSQTASSSQGEENALQDDPKDSIQMGEDDSMEYDQYLIFKHLCFYLDSPANAKKHGMIVKSKHEDDIGRNFDSLSKILKENGGRVVDLDEPKLTHVVVDKRDTSRRVELIKRTSKPKRRNLVISEFIQACLDEGTLLDEDEFAP